MPIYLLQLTAIESQASKSKHRRIEKNTWAPSPWPQRNATSQLSKHATKASTMSMTAQWLTKPMQHSPHWSKPRPNAPPKPRPTMAKPKPTIQVQTTAMAMATLTARATVTMWSKPKLMDPPLLSAWTKTRSMDMGKAAAIHPIPTV